MLIHSNRYYIRIFSVSSVPRCNLGPGSLRRLPPPPLHYGTRLVFTARRLQPFLPSSTRIELRQPMPLGAPSSWFLFIIFLQMWCPVITSTKPRSVPNSVDTSIVLSVYGPPLKHACLYLCFCCVSLFCVYEYLRLHV